MTAWTEQTFRVEISTPADVKPTITSDVIRQVLQQAFGGWPEITVTEELRALHLRQGA